MRVSMYMRANGSGGSASVGVSEEAELAWVIGHLTGRDYWARIDVWADDNKLLYTLVRDTSGWSLLTLMAH